MMTAQSVAAIPIIPEPEEDDPELARTRLYPTSDEEKLYGEPQSPEEERRQDLEWSTAEHYRRRGDLQGEIAHYVGILAQRPNDLAVFYYLGRSYLENGEPHRVIELIGEAHRRYPRLLDFQELLLEALIALGRAESDFEWASEIRIYRLDLDAIDRCYDYLKGKSRPRYRFEMAEMFSSEGCRLFSGSDLIEVLEEDERFIFEDGRVQVREKRVDKLKRWIRWVAKAGRR